MEVMNGNNADKSKIYKKNLIWILIIFFQVRKCRIDFFSESEIEERERVHDFEEYRIFWFGLERKHKTKFNKQINKQADMVCLVA